MQVADSPRSVAEQADVVLAMLADPPAALEVAHQIASGLAEGMLQRARPAQPMVA